MVAAQHDVEVAVAPAVDALIVATAIAADEADLVVAAAGQTVAARPAMAAVAASEAVPVAVAAPVAVPVSVAVLATVAVSAAVAVPAAVASVAAAVLAAVVVGVGNSCHHDKTLAAAAVVVAVFAAAVEVADCVVEVDRPRADDSLDAVPVAVAAENCHTLHRITPHSFVGHVRHAAITLIRCSNVTPRRDMKLVHPRKEESPRCQITSQPH